MRGWVVSVVAPALLVAGCGAPSHAHAAPVPTPAVITRSAFFSRGAGRPLPTTVWSLAGMTGRHPVVIFSHGLGGLPAQFAPIASTWAAAGFVVVAPAYPHTNGKVKIDPADVRRQPADALVVLHEIFRAPATWHADPSRILAVGFSAGGTTTLGLLRAGHLPGLRGAVSVAGRRPSSAFGGAPVPVLFLHGDRDPTVPIAAGRQAYAAVPPTWKKTFVVIAGGRHGDYLYPGNAAYEQVSARILDFLRTS
ncbi:alpha/beta hydrolase family protein [Actinoplanes sp. CA-030573]|uniref:alpha/beta hydrolase family protein n=1 Tax=Actinoplanes sp. CA-030573 TaxID=3239898 RepID=UPI003D92C929